MPLPLQFLIVHGACGSPQGNWFPWLEKELQNYGPVFVPRFPTPEGQNLEAWLNIATQALVHDEPSNTILSVIVPGQL